MATSSSGAVFRPATALRFLALALFLSCAAPKPKGPFLLHPVPPTLEGYTLTQGALVYTGAEFSVSARPWDWRLVEEEFHRSGEPCPFGMKEGDAARFLYFRVRLENRGTQWLIFNPLRASLLRPGEAPILPLELSDIFAFAGDEQKAAEASGKSFRRVCFDDTTSVRPGQAIERYVVFRAPEEAKLLTLELDDLWQGSKSFTLRFVLEAFPGEGEGDQRSGRNAPQTNHKPKPSKSRPEQK